MKKILTLLIICSLNLYGQDTYIYAGKIFDSKSGKIIENKTVIIEGNNIKSIRNGFIDPESEDVNIIDLKSKN